jgi:benzoylformate decarboxylase
VRPGRRAVLEQFAADGLSVMFGNPGTVEQGFLDELADFGAIRYVLALQEACAVGMADGYARATGGPALVQLHTGVGLGNGIGMLYQAMRGHSPLVVIAGEAGIAYDAMDGQMAADLVGMARPVTKYATRVVHPGSVLRVLRRAVQVAMTPPRGPVFVALPMDVLDQPNDEPVVPATIPDTRVGPAEDLLARAVELLRAAQRPVILAGDGVVTAGAQTALVRVAELLGADVWLVEHSEFTIDPGHPLFRGALGHMTGAGSTAAVADADAVLVVGTSLFPEVFPELSSPWPDARVVQVDLSPSEIGKNHPVDLGLVADPKLTLDAMLRALRQRAPAEAAGAEERLAKRRAEAEGAGAPPDEPDDAYGAVLRALAASVGDDVVLFDEALTASPRLLRHLPPTRAGDYFLTRGGSLGVGIPGAVGIKLARPDRTVVGVVGDGGSMYTIQSLWTAARDGIAAKIVVCDNGSYELLADNLADYRSERGIGERRMPAGFDLTRPPIGFAELARGLGVEAVQVHDPAEAGAAVDRMLRHDGPYLLAATVRD